ncbi:MAG TPA: hypothetical protein VG734_04130, partial [Lacunisphaera sp.]|nr:hypothetical protein [Lacunisphaera sp.]
PMNWNDYEAVWQRQPLPHGRETDLAELRQTFETKRRKMAAALLVRDWAEILACAVVVANFLFYWKKVGAAGWPLAGSVVLILGVALLFLRERWRARRAQSRPDASLRTKVELDLAELRHQRRLLLRVWIWYLAPCAIAMLIQAGVIIRQTPPWDPLRGPLSLALIVAFIAGVCWFAWWINRRAVRLRIEPRIAELEKLHRDLVDKNGGEAAAPVLARR